MVGPIVARGTHSVGFFQPEAITFAGGRPPHRVCREPLAVPKCAEGGGQSDPLGNYYDYYYYYYCSITIATTTTTTTATTTTTSISNTHY